MYHIFNSYSSLGGYRADTKKRAEFRKPVRLKEIMNKATTTVQGKWQKIFHSFISRESEKINGKINVMRSVIIARSINNTHNFIDIRSKASGMYYIRDAMASHNDKTFFFAVSTFRPETNRVVRRMGNCIYIPIYCGTITMDEGARKKNK